MSEKNIFCTDSESSNFNILETFGETSVPESLF